MAVMLKLSMPVITEFTLSELPSIWSFVISWLRPPYLYVVINCIIITIVASSRLQSKVDDHPLMPPETAALLQTEPIKLVTRVDVQPDYAAVYDSIVQKSEPVGVRPELENDYAANFVEVPEPDLYGTAGAGLPDTKTNFSANALEEMRSVYEFMIPETVRNTPKKDFMDFSLPREKPPVSARFGHRKSIKGSSEGVRTLGVAKPKRQDTLESTWKTITEGRPMPLTRHLRKSDTWETQGRHHNHMTCQSDQDPHNRMTKSETFNVSNPPTTSLTRSTGSGKLKKDVSLGQDELNKRVEAFIKKFNEDMRLQRLESLNQYMEMINRGAGAHIGKS